MGNHTTNRLERFHRTIKKMLQHRAVRFPELIQVLLDLILLRLSDREVKALRSKIRFPTAKPPALLEDLSKLFTPYAVKFVLAELRLPTTSYTTIKVKKLMNI